MSDERVATQSSANTPSKLGSLLAGHPSSDLVNNIVYLHHVKLEPGAMDNVYYAVDEEGRRMVVVVNGAGAPKQESMANLLGTIRPVGAEQLKKWRLDKAEKGTVKAQGIYIEAERVKVQKEAAAMASR